MSAPADPAALRATLQVFFTAPPASAERRHAEACLEAFKRRPDAGEVAISLLTSLGTQLTAARAQSGPSARLTGADGYLAWFGASVLDAQVDEAVVWARTEGAAKLRVRGLLTQFVVATAGALPRFAATKAAVALVHVARADWPGDFPDFWPLLTRTANSPPTQRPQRALGLMLLRTMVEEFLAVCGAGGTPTRRAVLPSARVRQVRELMSGQALMAAGGLLAAILATEVPLLGGAAGDDAETACVQAAQCLEELVHWSRALPKAAGASPAAAAATASATNAWAMSGAAMPSLLGMLQCRGRPSVSAAAVSCMGALLSSRQVPSEQLALVLSTAQNVLAMLRAVCADRAGLQDAAFTGHFTEFVAIFVRYHLGRFFSPTAALARHGGSAFTVSAFLQTFGTFTFSQVSADGYRHCLEVWVAVCGVVADCGDDDGPRRASAAPSPAARAALGCVPGLLQVGRRVLERMLYCAPEGARLLASLDDSDAVTGCEASEGRAGGLKGRSATLNGAQRTGQSSGGQGGEKESAEASVPSFELDTELDEYIRAGLDAFAALAVVPGASRGVLEMLEGPMGILLTTLSHRASAASPAAAATLGPGGKPFLSLERTLRDLGVVMQLSGAVVPCLDENVEGCGGVAAGAIAATQLKYLGAVLDVAALAASTMLYARGAAARRAHALALQALANFAPWLRRHEQRAGAAAVGPIATRCVEVALQSMDATLSPPPEIVLTAAAGLLASLASAPEGKLTAGSSRLRCLPTLVPIKALLEGRRCADLCAALPLAVQARLFSATVAAALHLPPTQAQVIVLPAIIQPVSSLVTAAHGAVQETQSTVVAPPRRRRGPVLPPLVSSAVLSKVQRASRILSDLARLVSAAPSKTRKVVYHMLSPILRPALELMLRYIQHVFASHGPGPSAAPVSPAARTKAARGASVSAHLFEAVFRAFAVQAGATFAANVLGQVVAVFSTAAAAPALTAALQGGCATGDKTAAAGVAASASVIVRFFGLVTAMLEESGSKRAGGGDGSPSRRTPTKSRQGQGLASVLPDLILLCCKRMHAAIHGHEHNAVDVAAALYLVCRAVLTHQMHFFVVPAATSAARRAAGQVVPVGRVLASEAAAGLLTCTLEVVVGALANVRLPPRLVRANLETLDMVDAQHALFALPYVQEHMAGPLTRVLLELHLGRSHALLTDEITTTLHRLATADTGRFLSLHVPAFLSSSAATRHVPPAARQQLHTALASALSAGADPALGATAGSGLQIVTSVQRKVPHRAFREALDTFLNDLALHASAAASSGR